MSEPHDDLHKRHSGSDPPDTEKEVFRGHFDECVDHLRMALLSQLPTNLKGAEKQRKPIAGFCQCGDEFVAASLKKPPKKLGRYPIRLMCYLDMVGYRVIDLERMKAPLRSYVELIGYGLLEPQAACDLIGYNQTSTLYDIIKETEGHCGISDAKLQSMWEEWKKRKDELDRKKAELKEKYFIEVPTDFIPGDRAEKHSVSSHPKMDVPQSKSTSRQSAVVCMMQALLILLEEKSSGGRFRGVDELRGSAGVVLSLSAQLSSISSCLLAPDRRKGDSCNGEK